MSHECDTNIDAISTDVDSLYDFRRRYFLLHPLDEAGLKPSRIQHSIDTILQAIAKAREGLDATYAGSGDAGPGREASAILCWLEGKARNATDEFDPQAEDAITKALKLDPQLGNSTDIHLELGECFWKKGDREGARLSFEQVLKSQTHSPPATVRAAKRNLSIILRQQAIGGTHAQNTQQFTALMEESRVMAKEALQMDLSDGTSWHILGNAHFSHFLIADRPAESLRLAMQAYSHALKDPLSQFNQDLHHNRGILMRFQEHYQQALEAFQLAVRIDPSWETARETCKQLETLLTEITHAVTNNAGLKHKQLNKILSKISSSHLGPNSGPFRQTEQDSTEIQLTQCTISQCIPGENTGKVLLVTVIAEVSSAAGGQPPYVCIVANQRDEAGSTSPIVDCAALSIFNAVSDFHLQRGDSIAIAQPSLSHHKFPFTPLENQEKAGDGSVECVDVGFCLFRVESPVDIIVNGRQPSKTLEARLTVGLQAKAS